MPTAREIMSETVTYLEPSSTVADAAQAMAADDYGALPVCEDGKLVGMLTDRDLVVRASCPTGP